MACLYDFPLILGMEQSSQLANSYFSEGLKPPTSYGMSPGECVFAMEHSI